MEIINYIESKRELLLQEIGRKQEQGEEASFEEEKLEIYTEIRDKIYKEALN